MSSNPSILAEGYEASKKRREAAMASTIYETLRDFVLHRVIVPEDGMAMSMDAAFKIDRKELAARALEQLASELRRKR